VDYAIFCTICPKKPDNFLMEFLRSLKNQFDFFLRSQFRMGRSLPAGFSTPSCDLALQDEVRSFIEIFPWEEELSRFSKNKALRVLDVGARNFSLAPMLDQFFFEKGYAAELHGIEVDGYRRMVDFRTRRDFGNFYAKKARRAQFHCMDFLDWKKPAEIIFLLNPFVSSSPTLAWGLPLTLLKPEKVFNHAAALIKDSKGLLVLSNPSKEEYEISLELALGAGLTPLKKAEWQPSPESTQQRPRFGQLFTHR